jgi:ribosomal protein S18 acetylase RimI-like enzyme
VNADSPDTPVSDPDDDDFDLDFDYDEITLLTGGAELLDDIEPLWLLLRQHHAEMSPPMWREGLLDGQFPERKAGLLRKSQGGALLVVLAVRAGEPCGYCVCTVSGAGEGEVDSLFVAPEIRRRGIGDAMMTRAMPWLMERTPGRSIVVDVMSCNEAALRFYERYGFHTRTVRMRHVPAETSAEAVQAFTAAVHVSEAPEPPAPPPVPLEYRTLRQPPADPMEQPAAVRRARHVIPIEFDVVIAQTKDQAAAAAIEQQLKREGVPVYRTHDGPVVDQTIELIVRAEDRERAMRVAEGIFVRRRRIKSFPRQAPK